MSIEKLNIRRAKNYITDPKYSKDLNLSPLIFEQDNILIYINAWSEKLDSINIFRGKFEKKFQISEDKYDMLICPVYFIQANIGYKGRDGFINGVIRPDISENLIKILPNAPQTFHFYYEGIDDKLLGVSTSHTDKQLLVQFTDWDIRECEKFKKVSLKNPKRIVPSWFEVKLDFESNPDSRKYGHFISRS